MNGSTGHKTIPSQEKLWVRRKEEEWHLGHCGRAVGRSWGVSRLRSVSCSRGGSLCAVGAVRPSRPRAPSTPLVSALSDQLVSRQLASACVLLVSLRCDLQDQSELVRLWRRMLAHVCDSMVGQVSAGWASCRVASCRVVRCAGWWRRAAPGVRDCTAVRWTVGRTGWCGGVRSARRGMAAGSTGWCGGVGRVGEG